MLVRRNPKRAEPFSKPAWSTYRMVMGSLAPNYILYDGKWEKLFNQIAYQLFLGRVALTSTRLPMIPYLLSIIFWGWLKEHESSKEDTFAWDPTSSNECVWRMGVREERLESTTLWDLETYTVFSGYPGDHLWKCIPNTENEEPVGIIPSNSPISGLLEWFSCLTWDINHEATVVESCVVFETLQKFGVQQTSRFE